MKTKSSRSNEYPTTAGFKMTAAFETNLVDHLLNEGLLDAKDIELAKHYQQRMSMKGRDLPLTYALIELDLVDKNLIHHMMIEESLKLETADEDNSPHIDELIRTKTEIIQRQLDLLHSALEIIKQIIASPTLYEVYQRTCSLVSTHYGYPLAGFFTPTTGNTALTLTYSNLTRGPEGFSREIKIAENSKAGVVTAFQSRRRVLLPHGPNSDTHRPDYLLPGIRAELNIPVATSEEHPVIFHVQASQPDAFDEESVNLLQTIITSIAPIVQSHHATDGTNETLGTLSTLYQASQGLSQAKTGEEVYRQSIKYLKQLPYKSVILTTNENTLKYAASDDNINFRDQLITSLNEHQVTVAEIENNLIFQEYLFFTKELIPTGLPDSFNSILDDLGVLSLSILPMRVDHQLIAIIFLGSDTSDTIEENSLQLLTSMVDLATAAMQRVKSLESVERRLSQLEVIDSISQAIAFETDIHNLYRVIHEQITRVMGDVNLIIATYDPETNLIEIPYAFEENKTLVIHPFDLGEGLTSILIKHRKPLLLVEDTEKKAAELGAKVIGAPAKSWLGVPMLLGGEPIGAIIVQDLKKEHRFDERDQGLLSTLSSQVAVSIRNAHLIHNAATKADFEKDAFAITHALWSMTDVELIIQTALEQLGKRLHASKGMIQLELEPSHRLNTPEEANLP